MIKITDKRFKYTPSFNTDLKARFKKENAVLKARAEQEAAAVKAQAELDAANAAEAQAKVQQLQKRGKA